MNQYEIASHVDGYMMLHPMDVRLLPKKARDLAFKVFGSDDDNLESILKKLHSRDSNFRVERTENKKILVLYYKDTAIADIRQNTGNIKLDTNTSASYLDICGGVVIQKELSYIPA